MGTVYLEHCSCSAFYIQNIVMLRNNKRGDFTYTWEENINVKTIAVS
jgi:hypothetical protein